jgi:glutathione S-transferase
MKLFYSPVSPYVRKCLVAAHELGLAERIERLPEAARPLNRLTQNPLGKVPTLLADDGTVLYDSRVIVEYLNALAGGALIPIGGPERFAVLVEHALADGILDAAILVRYETAVRPEPLRWNDWTAGQMEKIHRGLADLESRSTTLGERVDVATITFGCALDYLDFRFAAIGWRDKHPRTAEWFARFSERPSMVATRPHA